MTDSDWPRPTPLVAPVVLERRGPGAAASTLTVDPGEPLLAGHYPGFPILPGVCLVECAHRTALAAVGDPAATLAEVESTRFLGPVRPGDTVRTEVTAEPVDGGWRARAELTTATGRAATVRLRYGTAPALLGPGGPTGLGAGGPGPDTGRPGGLGTAVLGVAGIQALLPHRHPMLLVDAVHALVPGGSVVATKAVTATEPCYARLPAGATDLGYPPTLLVESWCQAAALLACAEAPNPDVLSGQVALFGGISGLRFGPPVLPGSRLVHTARLLRQTAGAAVLTGTTELDGRAVLDVGTVTVAFRPAGVLAPA